MAWEMVYWRQAISWADVDLSSVGFVSFEWEQKYSWYQSIRWKIEIHTDKITAVSPRRQWVNALYYDQC